ncbi:MAG: site-2 protease family protein [Desulfamplus sp.]|nr:site-2 protease family protein [Desulfamplus sp.]
MPISQSLPIDIPFILNFSNLEFDKMVIFFVAILLSITVNAEAQAFMATILGDIKDDAKDRFHFNPLLHINLAGLICFAVAGFGWARPIEINTSKFKRPAIAVAIIRFTGAFGNLLLASIAASILFVMKKWNLEDQVFSIVVAVNIMVFVYNFVPVPPLAGAYILFSIISAFLPTSFLNLLFANTKIININRYFIRITPYIFVGVLIVMKINGLALLNETLYPVIRAIFQFVAG